MDLTADLTVDSSGFHKLRSGSDMEDHMYNPLTILTLQQAVRTGDFDCFRRYSAMVDDEQLPHTLRVRMVRGLYLSLIHISCRRRPTSCSHSCRT